ncbi:hypothetical protein Tco_0695701 [Tanacetum coccineum]
MVRDTIQLETAVSTISQEYLLEFTFEYSITEDLRPELPGPRDRIVDFSEGKVGVYTKIEPEILLGDDVHPTFLNDDDRKTDLFNLIRASNPTKVKIGTRPRAAHEVPLLTVTASRIIEMEEPVAATESSRTPSTIERLSLDFANENPSQQITRDDGTEDQVQGIVASEVPPPENVTTTGVSLETDLGEEVAVMGPRVSKKRRKRGNDGAGANAPPKVLRKDHAASRPTPSTAGGKSLALVGLETGSTFPVPAPQEIPVNASDPDPLSYANPQSIPERDVAQSSKGAAVAGDPESENTSFTSMVGSPGNIYQPGSSSPTGSEDIGYGKRYKEPRGIAGSRGRVEKRCAEMDVRLDALSIDFEEELYPHMLTVIVGRRWVIGHALRLAVIKCTESAELRQAFADVVSARIAKGMSEGLKHGVEHGKASLDLEVIEAYNPEADTKYVAALHALRDLKYLMVDQLESLKDAPIDVIMASLHLESDSEEDAPQWIQILLEDVIAANVSRVEKKKKCRVVCRTHGVRSTHHARSDGVPVSVPTVAPQGLAILLADAAPQTETFEDEASPRLFRSKSLPPMYNLDWP